MKKFMTFAVLLISQYSNAQVEHLAASTASGNPVEQLTLADTQLYFYGELGSREQVYRISNKMKTPVTTGMINTASSGGSGRLHDVGLIRCMVNLKGKMYFAANNGVAGTELWTVSAGVAPALVKDLYPGPVESNPDYFVTLNDKVYFSFQSVALWQYDPVTNIAKSVAHYGSDSVVNASNTFVYNNKVYYSGSVTHGTLYGIELWQYDPIADSNKLMFDLNTGPAHSSPTGFYVFNGILYFIAKTAANGFELYSWDWVNAPKRLTDINPGSGDGFRVWFDCRGYILDYNGSLIITTGQAADKQRLLKYDIVTGNLTTIDTITCSQMCKFAGKIYFAGFYGNMLAMTNPGIYSYDGINPIAMEYSTASNPYKPYELVPMNDCLYFIGPGTTNKSTGDLYRLTRFPSTVEKLNGTCTVTQYPNPVVKNAFLDIDVTQATLLSVNLTDVTGKLIYALPAQKFSIAKHTLMLPMDNLPAGQYCYTVYAGQQIQASGKIGKQ